MAARLEPSEMTISRTYKEITKRFSKLGRAMTIQMHSPVCIFNDKYLVLL